MTDYSQLKVPDLKKLLQERSLPVSGNKAELIARLQEADRKPSGGAAGEDEIDWDEDDAKTAVAPATIAEIEKAPTPAAASVQKPTIESSKTADVKADGGEIKADSVVAPATEAAPAPEAPKVDFSAGIEKTDAEKELERRAKRAARFGIDAEEQKKLERVKKFGVQDKDSIVNALDSALSGRRQKRGREDKEGGRSAKRQTPDVDRRSTPASKTTAAVKKPSTRVTDDPSEKAKAEARAKRFAAA